MIHEKSFVINRERCAHRISLNIWQGWNTSNQILIYFWQKYDKPDIVVKPMFFEHTYLFNSSDTKYFYSWNAMIEIHWNNFYLKVIKMFLLEYLIKEKFPFPKFCLNVVFMDCGRSGMWVASNNWTYTSNFHEPLKYTTVFINIFKFQQSRKNWLSIAKIFHLCLLIR